MTAAAHKINGAARELSTLAAAGCVDSLQPAAACSDEARSRTRAKRREKKRKKDEKRGLKGVPPETGRKIELFIRNAKENVTELRPGKNQILSSRQTREKKRKKRRKTDEKK